MKCRSIVRGSSRPGRWVRSKNRISSGDKNLCRRYTLRNINELKPDEIDCILIPGGFSPDYLRRDAERLELVRQAHQRGKVLAAICHGLWVLISAGVIAGKRATGLVGRAR